MDRERKESAARTKIIDTATRLFYQDGIRATGIDAVIEQAGVARMTLYHHFPSKDALVEAVLQRISDRITERINAIVADPAQPARRRLLDLFRFGGELLTRETFRGCPFINAAVENPDHGSRAFCLAVSHKEKVADAVAKCVDELDVARPQELTDQLTLLMDGASVRAQLGFGKHAADAAYDAAACLIDAALAKAEE